MFKFRKVKSCLFAAAAIFPERLVSRHRYYKRKSIWLPSQEKRGEFSRKFGESSLLKNRKTAFSRNLEEKLSNTKKRIHSSMRLSGQFEPIIELQNDKKQDISGRVSTFYQLSLSKREYWNHTRKKVKTILQLHPLVQKGSNDSSKSKDKESLLKQSRLAKTFLHEKSRINTSFTEKMNNRNTVENSKETSFIVPHLFCNGLLRSGERFSRLKV